MFNHILDVFNSVKATGMVAFLVAIIPVIYKYVSPLLQKKIATEKNIQAQQALELGLKFANVIVPELAVLAALSKSDRSVSGCAVTAGHRPVFRNGIANRCRIFGQNEPNS